MPLSKLNKEQFNSATAPFGHNLIIASAGTGKTSTIVARIAYLLQQNYDPQDILLLTFTNKAAAEMIERVGNIFDKKTASCIQSGTFHAVSYRLLKSLGENISLKQPKELKILLKTIYDKRRFDHIEANTKPYQASTLYELFSLFQNTAPNCDFATFIEQNNADHEPYGLIYEDILKEFCDQKKSFGYVDFNDLLILMKNKLNNGANIRFKEILVDEYQDTNTLQGLLIDSFKPKSLFCVGDYDQSIYAFNGANIENIGTFTKRYKDANIFTLTKNYRSTEPILALANNVISRNPRLYPKSLEVTRKEGAYEPKLLVYDELFNQYRAIADMIKRSIDFHDNIAVIFRNNSSADGIETSLRELGISCKRKGGVSFFDTKEVKAAIDLLSLALNPKDMMAFIHVFEYAKNISPSIAKELFDGLYTLGDGDISKGFFEPLEGVSPFKKLKSNHQLGLFDIDYSLGSVQRFYSLGFEEQFLANPILKHAKLNSESAVFLYDFYTFLKEAKKLKNPYSLLNLLKNSTIFNQIANFLANKRAQRKDGLIDQNRSKEAKDRIYQKITTLQESSKYYTSLERYLNALTLGGSEISEGVGVNLLTIHASKGLEFNEVYVVDLMQGRFPNLKLMSGGGGIEEERRLFYVAATRAKNKLYLSYATYDKVKKISYEPSIFLKEANLI